MKTFLSVMFWVNISVAFVSSTLFLTLVMTAQTASILLLGSSVICYLGAAAALEGLRNEIGIEFESEGSSE